MLIKEEGTRKHNDQPTDLTTPILAAYPANGDTGFFSSRCSYCSTSSFVTYVVPQHQQTISRMICSVHADSMSVVQFNVHVCKKMRVAAVLSMAGAGWKTSSNRQHHQYLLPEVRVEYDEQRLLNALSAHCWLRGTSQPHLELLVVPPIPLM